jgi:Holliday junction resolvase RusA-like endonuclease
MKGGEMHMVRFTVNGNPAPKGSMRGVWSERADRVIVKNDNKRTKPWANAVAWGARQAMALEMRRPAALEGPIVVYATFYLPAPQDVPKERKGTPAAKPDVDKLLRNVLDALKVAGIYEDDGQVVLNAGHKIYAGGPEDEAGPTGKPRAFIAFGEYQGGQLMRHMIAEPATNQRNA